MKSRAKILLIITLNDGAKPKLRKNQYCYSLYLVINKNSEYIEESYGKKYLTLVSTDESKDKLKKI